MAKSDDAPFTSHPDPDLLKIHPLENFGCSPCHGGNGRAIDSVDARPRPLRTLALASLLSARITTPAASNATPRTWSPSTPTCSTTAASSSARRAASAAIAIRASIIRMSSSSPRASRFTSSKTTRLQNELEIPRLQKHGDRPPDNDAANRFYAQATNLTVTDQPHGCANRSSSSSAVTTSSQEIKKVGPDLKEVRMKLHKEWIPYWIGHTHEFRPTTKMPQFRLSAGRSSGHRRVHLAIRPHRPGARTSDARKCRARQGTFRRARLPGLPLHRRRLEHGGRHFRRQSQPRRRKRKLRLRRPLGPQSAPAHAALLPVREKRSRPRRLRQAQSSVRFRSRSLALPERRPRTRRPAADRHAQPAPDRWTTRATSPAT